MGHSKKLFSICLKFTFKSSFCISISWLWQIFPKSTLHWSMFKLATGTVACSFVSKSCWWLTLTCAWFDCDHFQMWLFFCYTFGHFWAGGDNQLFVWTLQGWVNGTITIHSLSLPGLECLTKDVEVIIQNEQPLSSTERSTWRSRVLLALSCAPFPPPPVIAPGCRNVRYSCGWEYVCTVSAGQQIQWSDIKLALHRGMGL